MKTPNNPYEFIDRNIEAVQTAPDTAPVKRERSLKNIENGLIDDTLTLISLLDGSVTESDHLQQGKREASQPFDAAIFLDKSARPVRKLTHDLWDVATDKPEPRSLFLNVDKRPWLRAMGHNDNKKLNLEDIDANSVSLDLIDEEYLHRELSAIRALYLSPSDFEQIDEENLDNVWNLPTQLDGKTIAIIDEVKSSGNTLRIAIELLKKAIPEAHFEGMWWSDPGRVTWSGGEDVGYQTQFAAKFVPPWYDSDRESGRGVGDIDIPHSASSASKAQRIGRSILSRPEVDSAGKYASHRTISASVRRDLDQLAKRYKSKELVDYRPSVFIDDDTFDKRLERYYQEPAETVLKKWREQNNK